MVFAELRTAFNTVINYHSKNVHKYDIDEKAVKQTSHSQNKLFKNGALLSKYEAKIQQKLL